MLSDGLSTNQGINTYKLSGNRITEKGADKLLKIINKFAKDIDLSKNRIGSLGCEQLTKALEITTFKLISINIEDNNIGDIPINNLLKACSTNFSLKVLNISKNRLTDYVYFILLDFKCFKRPFNKQ